MYGAETDMPAGLTSSEVEASLARSGSNILGRKKRTSFFSRLLASLGDPIIKILLAALAVNLLFLFRGNGWFETVGIAAAVFLASFISTISEYGSESAFIRLQDEAARAECRVRRDGKTVVLPIEQLVCGDIVPLGAGEGVPADGVMLSGRLGVDQSALNGESREATKKPGGSERRWDLQHGEQLFRGSIITSGDGIMVVRRVGDGTFFGSMAASLQDEPPVSPLKERLSMLAGHISRLGYLAALLIALADLFSRIVIANGFVLSLIMAELGDMPSMLENLLHTATLAISVVIVAVPEGLPMMITVVLSRSMFRMVKDNVMVRKLTGIETAGSVNILFTDKTGTLTRGKLAVTGIICADGRVLDGDSVFAAAPDIGKLVTLSGLYNTSAVKIAGDDGFKASGGNATDRALMQHISAAPGGAWRRTAYLPFDPERKYSAASIESEDVLHMVKGAPELLIPLCNRCCKGDKLSSFNPSLSERARVTAAKNGERLLCICLSDSPVADKLPDSLTFVCMIIIRDTLRQGAADAVHTMKRAGIQVVMMTGDSCETATAIAGEAGLLDGGGDAVYSSSELAAMSDAEIARALPAIRVIARALPTDKSRLVRIAQDAGLVCAMTGDGINDAPALRLADVGFAMGSGTQVAKEAGDIIILDDNIASICKAILHGRTIFKSIQKFIVFQLTINLCAVGISLIGPFIGVESPVTVLQMLWINIIMDTLAGLAFAGEPPLDEYMTAPPKKRGSPVLTAEMTKQIAAMGAFGIAACVLFLKSEIVFLYFGCDSGRHMTGFFALFVFIGVFGAFCARTEGANILRGLTRNKMFISVMALVSAVQLAMIYFGGALFRTDGLSVGQLIFVLAIASTIIPADIARKLLSKRRKMRYNGSWVKPSDKERGIIVKRT